MFVDLLLIMIILGEFAEIYNIGNDGMARLGVLQACVKIACVVINKPVAVLSCTHSLDSLTIKLSFHDGYKETRDITPEEEVLLLQELANSIGCTATIEEH